jgi:hypothetical protein
VAPPVAESVAAYGVLALPSGNVEFAIARIDRGVTVTIAVACKLGFAVLVAVMMAEVLLLTLGATKAPAFEIVPMLEDQVTAVLAVPVI